VQPGKSLLLCLHTSLGSLLFDPFGTPFHIYHFPSIIDVARIHLMNCLMSIPLMGCFSVCTASLVVLYKGSPTCPVVAGRVSCLSSNLLPSRSLLPVVETVPFHQTQRLGHGGSALSFSSLLYSTLRNSHYSLRTHCIGGDTQAHYLDDYFHSHEKRRKKSTNSLNNTWIMEQLENHGGPMPPMYSISRRKMGNYGSYRTTTQSINGPRRTTMCPLSSW
jgi:hypothetical protein